MKTSNYYIMFQVCLAWVATPMAVAGGDREHFGLTEEVYIPELDLTYEAKVDTGAETASLNAVRVRIQGDEDDDEARQVSFRLVLPDGETRDVTLPLFDTIRIKKRAAAVNQGEEKYTERASLQLTLCIGKQAHEVEVNLADRRRFSTDMLVGSRALLKFGALVDPAGEKLQGHPRCSQSLKKDHH